MNLLLVCLNLADPNWMPYFLDFLSKHDRSHLLLFFSEVGMYKDAYRTSSKWDCLLLALILLLKSTQWNENKFHFFFLSQKSIHPFPSRAFRVTSRGPRGDFSTDRQDLLRLPPAQRSSIHPPPLPPPLNHPTTPTYTYTQFEYLCGRACAGG